MNYNWNSELVLDVNKYSDLIAYRNELIERKLVIVVKSPEYSRIIRVERMLEVKIGNLADLLDVKYGQVWRNLWEVAHEVFREK